MARHNHAKPHSHKPSQPAAETVKTEAPAARPEAVPMQSKETPSQPPSDSSEHQTLAAVPQEPEEVASQRAVPTQEQIAQRAYELYLSRGGDHGHHEDDWAQAERELTLSR